MKSRNLLELFRMSIEKYYNIYIINYKIICTIKNSQNLDEMNYIILVCVLWCWFVYIYIDIVLFACVYTCEGKRSISCLYHSHFWHCFLFYCCCLFVCLFDCLWRQLLSLNMHPAFGVGCLIKELLYLTRLLLEVLKL
jgi:RsiW-degrading membrane proteinase PrsW (M82 family)